MDTSFDSLFSHHGKLIAGIDESGVCDIAGPLIAACVILPPIDLHTDDLRIFEVNDSKKVPEKFRRRYAELIFQTAHAIGIGQVEPGEIDFLGQNRATRLAMLRAIAGCSSIRGKTYVKPDFLMIDGEIKLDTVIPQKGIPDGDAKSLTIACASILAKVIRDDIMVQKHEQYPYYGWDRNKGFSNQEHLSGIDKYGVILGFHRTRVWPFVANKKETNEWRTRRKNWKNITEKLILENTCQDIENKSQTHLHSLVSLESILQS